MLKNPLDSHSSCSTRNAYSDLSNVMNTWTRHDNVRLELIDTDEESGFTCKIEFDRSVLNYELVRRLQWATTYLENNINCVSHGITKWYFKSRTDAEKFLTVYYLRWS